MEGGGRTVTITVRELADWVHGEVLGDGDLPIRNARPLTEAESGDITLVTDAKHLNAWEASSASAAVVRGDWPLNGRPLIRVQDPLMAFAHIVQTLRGKYAATAPRIDPTAHIHPTAQLADDVRVGPYVVIGAYSTIGAGSCLHAGVNVGQNCTLAEKVTLYPHVVLYDDCVLGNRVSVHANTVIGSEGFGYRTQGGVHVKVPQLGRVEIGDDVEIGACCTIDRGTFGPTRIGTGTKIDNLVQIAHNCQVGKHNLIVAQVGIAGSSSTGEYVVMAGQVGVSDHVHVGDRAVVGAQSGITKDLPPGERYFGTPASPVREYLRATMTREKFAKMLHEIKRIKAHLGLGD